MKATQAKIHSHAETAAKILEMTEGGDLLSYDERKTAEAFAGCNESKEETEFYGASARRLNSLAESVFGKAFTPNFLHDQKYITRGADGYVWYKGKTVLDHFSYKPNEHEAERKRVLEIAATIDKLEKIGAPVNMDNCTWRLNLVDQISPSDDDRLFLLSISAIFTTQRGEPCISIRGDSSDVTYFLKEQGQWHALEKKDYFEVNKEHGIRLTHLDGAEHSNPMLYASIGAIRGYLKQINFNQDVLEKAKQQHAEQVAPSLP